MKSVLIGADIASLINDDAPDETVGHPLSVLNIRLISRTRLPTPGSGVFPEDTA